MNRGSFHTIAWSFVLMLVPLSGWSSGPELGNRISDPAPPAARAQEPKTGGGGVFREGSSAIGPRSSAAPASGAITDPNDPGLSAPEQKTVYERANENLITKTMYVRQNLESVKQYISEIEDPDSTYKPADLARNIARETSNYCSVDSMDSEDDQRSKTLSCLKEYQSVQIGQLEDVKSALSSNQSALASLQTNLTDAKGAALSKLPTRAVAYGANITSTNFPRVPTFLDLSASYQFAPKADKKSLQAFAQKLLSPPSPCDYQEVQQYLLDPKKTGGDTFSVASEGCKNVDKKAFTAANVRYQAMLKNLGLDSKDPLFQQKLKTKSNEIAQHMSEVMRNNSDPKTGKDKSVAQLLSAGPGTKSSQDCLQMPDGPRKDYCLARQLIVMKFNGEDLSADPKKKNSLNLLGTTQKTTSAFREDYVLKGRQPASVQQLPNVSNSDGADALYMDPSQIDSVMDQQLGISSGFSQ